MLGEGSIEWQWALCDLWSWGGYVEAIPRLVWLFGVDSEERIPLRRGGYKTLVFQGDFLKEINLLLLSFKLLM